MKKRSVFLLFFLYLLITATAQPLHQIRGTVIDKASRKPLEFINVVIAGSGMGSVTDSMGHFTIQAVPPGIYRLQASAVGYKTTLTSEYILSTKNLNIDIEMEENPTELEGVTITASPFRRDLESPVGLRIIGVQEIEKSPGANRDISRVVQSYPGVAFSPAVFIAIETHGKQDIFDCPVCQFGNGKACPTEKVNHIRCPVQSSNGIGRVVITVMESPSVHFERTGQSRCRTAAVVNPSGEGFQVLQFLRRVFHHQNACDAPGGLCIERIHIDAVAFRFGIYLVGDSIPAQCPLRF